MEKIISKTVLIDQDGVLTNNLVYYDGRGHRIKGFHSRDIRAIRQLVAHGYDVHILTQSSWPGVKDFAHRTGAEVIIDREKKVDQFSDFIAIGDDTADLAMLKKAVQAYCPLDADPEVKGLANMIILSAKGGEGVMAELVRALSKSLAASQP